MNAFRTIRRAGYFLAAAILGGAGANVLRATEYTITTVPTGNIVPFGAPSINNAGTIAFAGTPNNSNSAVATGIYTYSGGVVSTVTDNSGPLTTFVSAALINNNGLVAFRGAPSFAGPSGIYTASVGGPMQTIAVESNSVALNGGWALNDAGTVVFSGGLNGKLAILSGNGGALTTVSIAGGIEGYKSFGQSVAINSSGVVAFTASTNTDNFVATHAPAQIGSTNVADTGDPSSTYGSPAINNSGTVAFAGPMSSTPTFPGIYTQAVGGSVTPFVVSGGASGFQSVGPEVLNNNGEIVFEGLDLPQTGIIFDGPSPSDQVFSSNSFGLPISEFSFGASGLNDNGQVAFWYQLNNGDVGIGLATPTPEPTSLTGLAAGGLALLRRRRV